MRKFLWIVAVIVLSIVLNQAPASAQQVAQDQPKEAVKASTPEIMSLPTPEPPRILALEVPQQGTAGVLYEVLVRLEGDQTAITRLCFSWAGDHYSGWAGPYCFKPDGVRPGEAAKRLFTRNPGMYTLAVYAEYGGGGKTTNTAYSKTRALEIR